MPKHPSARAGKNVLFLTLRDYFDFDRVANSFEQSSELLRKMSIDNPAFDHDLAVSVFAEIRMRFEKRPVKPVILKNVQRDRVRECWSYGLGGFGKLAITAEEMIGFSTRHRHAVKSLPSRPQLDRAISSISAYLGIACTEVSIPGPTPSSSMVSVVGSRLCPDCHAWKVERLLSTASTETDGFPVVISRWMSASLRRREIGRASCRERV